MRYVKKQKFFKGLKDLLCCANLLAFFLAAGFADEETLVPTVLFFLTGIILGMFAFVAKTFSLYYERKIRTERV